MVWNSEKLKLITNKVDSTKLIDIFLNLNKYILFIWIFINIAIPIFTLFYYFWSLEFYHFFFWVFIPDSYTSAILFGIFLFVTLGLKKNVQVLNIVTFIGLIKVFFAYLTLIVFEPSYFDLVSLFLHIFELIEGLVVLLFLRANNRDFSFGSFIIIIDLFFDFFNPFGLPTLFLYPYHQDYNQNPTEPYLLTFFLIYSALVFFLLSFIRLKKWTRLKSLDENSMTIKSRY
jgi:uncharacterized membrane protein YpjA